MLSSRQQGKHAPLDSRSPVMSQKNHRKTCRRINEPGHAHELTFTCFKNIPLLSKDRTRQWFLDSLCKAAEKHSFHLWAYVIMPNHVHLLVWPTRKKTRSAASSHQSNALSLSARSTTFAQTRRCFSNAWNIDDLMGQRHIAFGNVEEVTTAT